MEKILNLMKIINPKPITKPINPDWDENKNRPMHIIATWLKATDEIFEAPRGGKQETKLEMTANVHQK